MPPCGRAANIVGNHRIRCSDSTAVLAEMCALQIRISNISPVGRTVVAHLGRGIHSGHENSMCSYISGEEKSRYSQNDYTLVVLAETGSTYRSFLFIQAAKAENLEVLQRP